MLIFAAYWRFVPALQDFFELRRRLLELVPTPEEHHWLAGHAIPDPAKAREKYLEWTRKMPRQYLQMLAVFPMVNVNHPETIADALRGSHPKPAYLYDFMKDFLGNGLVSSGGERWTRDRRLLTKTFKQEMLRSYVAIYKDAASTLVEKWLNHKDEAINLEVDMALVTYDIIMQCAMDIKSNCQLETDSEQPHMKYLDNARWLSEATARRYGNLLYHNNFIFFNLTSMGREFHARRESLRSYCNDVIGKRKAELQEDEAGTSMLDCMLTVRDEDDVGLSNTEVCDHVNTFLDAGHDTTSYTLQWLIYYLCVHPDIQDKCREEITTVLEKCGGISELEQKHLDGLQYVTQCIHETLRIAAIASCFARVLKKDTKVGEYVLPKDTAVQVTVIGLHHNPDVWPDSETFDPDRFSPENSKDRHPYAFIPFGAGVRSCIGQHMAMDESRVLLAAILSTFRLTLDDKTAKKPDWIVQVVSKPDPPVKIRVEML